MRILLDGSAVEAFLYPCGQSLTTRVYRGTPLEPEPDLGLYIVGCGGVAQLSSARAWEMEGFPNRPTE